jgi:hypothetical protein
MTMIIPRLPRHAHPSPNPVPYPCDRSPSRRCFRDGARCKGHSQTGTDIEEESLYTTRLIYFTLFRWTHPDYLLKSVQRL